MRQRVTLPSHAKTTKPSTIHRSDFQLAEGKSDQPLLVSGHFLALTAHPKAKWNDLWLLTEVHHEGKQPQVLEESVTSDTTALKDDFHQGYRNRFQATPWDVPNRPPLRHPKPRILGSQSAVVTGPKGEEIHCDEYGRVKVQFHWDREGQADDKTSCWLRVSSAWAGAQYSGIAIPRIGMEVLVTFLEGDPDQPLISGCLYHNTDTTKKVACSATPLGPAQQDFEHFFALREMVRRIDATRKFLNTSPPLCKISLLWVSALLTMLNKDEPHGF